MNLKKLFYYLNENQGRTISRKELDRLIAKKRNPKQRLRNPNNDSFDSAVIIGELELLGLLVKDRANYTITKPNLITARVSMNPAGLIFAVPRINAQAAKYRLRDVFVAPENNNGALSADMVQLQLIDRRRDRFEGEIVSITKRARRFHRFRVLSVQGDKHATGILLDMPGKFLSLVNLKGLPADTLRRVQPDTVLITSLSGRSVRYQNTNCLQASFVRFEDGSTADRDFERILLKYNLDPVYAEFPLHTYNPDRLNELDASEKKRLLKDRKDLRNLYTITIDGADSKDFDDALSLEIKSKRKWILYVHIADVSLYVEKDSPLDEEARRRTTSYYLANRVIPMLPPELSEELCSLIAGKDRFTVTAEIEIDQANGQIKSSSFYRSLINVNRRYTYNDAEFKLDDESEDPILSKLWQLATKQKQSRISIGRLDLEIPEATLQYDSSDQVTLVKKRSRLRSSMLIEECMLSANTAVAMFLRKRNAPTLYRIHAAMDETKLDVLNTFFNIYNIDFQMHDTEQSTIQEALAIVQKKGESESRIFNMLLLRAFMQAQYNPEPSGHWALAFTDYCHFTSPIRRYPDLVVHRSLLSLLTGKKQAYTQAEVESLAIETSEGERQSLEAERDILKLKLIRMIEQTGKTEFHGFLTGFRPDLVYLELEEFPVEGVVAAMHLSRDAELVLPDPFSVYIKRLSRPAFLGERWQLELDRIDTEAMRIYFKPIWGSSKDQAHQKPLRKKKR